MRPDAIVVLPPPAGDATDFLEAVEDFAVEQFAPQPFERIRRITGYLVGTLDRFNDGKRAEEHDRVKHAV